MPRRHEFACVECGETQTSIDKGVRTRLACQSCDAIQSFERLGRVE